MIDNKIRKAHTDLISCHGKIPKEFARLGNSFLRDYLGDFYSADLRRQVLEHGDGYTLRSVPVSVEEMLDVDELVLIVMNYPLLSQESVFDPHTHLPNISYWRDRKGLQQEINLSDGRIRKFHFLVWEQLCPTHGDSDIKAFANQRSLFRRRQNMKRLIPAQRRKSEYLLMMCKDWLVGQGRKLVVVTNSRKKNFDSPIAQLIGDEAVWHIRTNLYHPKLNLMNRLITDLYL